jgi:protein SCO1/2
MLKTPTIIGKLQDARAILRTGNCRLAAAGCLLFLIHCSLLTALAQGGPPGPSSPLYGPRAETGAVQSGLPPALRNVAIEQKLNQQLPLDLVFHDENGETVELGQYFGQKPIVLSLVYYDCPMLCTQVLNGMITSFRVLPFQVGKEFDVVTVSFDPREMPPLAAAKKKTYVGYLPQAMQAGANNGWHFLTGDQENISQLADAVGFRYHYDEATKQFAHASAIMVATPRGKLSRYYYGIDYSARDLRLGLIESAQNKIGTPVDQLLLYCYHYDPATGKYGAVVMNIMRLAGIATVIGIIVMLLLLKRLTPRTGKLPAVKLKTGGAA